VQRSELETQQDSTTRLPKLLYSRKEASQILGMAEQTLAVWACKKRYPLPVTKIGSRCFYTAEAISAFIAAGLQK
jgi:hypothetical protein